VQSPYQSYHFGIETCIIWNCLQVQKSINRTILELKRYNYRICTTNILTINRTILELKQYKYWNIRLLYRKLSIVPFWNWNFLDFIDNSGKLIAINRTILELKHWIKAGCILCSKSINRTILELKLVSKSNLITWYKSYQSYHFGIETWHATS